MLFGYNQGGIREYDLKLNADRTHIFESYPFEGDLLIDLPKSLFTNLNGVDWFLGENRTRRQSTARAKSRSLDFCKVAGCLLLSLSFIIALISPFSESVATFDNFPRGGQDCELSCFLVIMLLCLTLLAALWGKRIVDELFGEGSWEPHDFWENTANLFRSILNISIIWGRLKEPFSLGAVPLPLRI